jgi:hypothetical protein
MSNRTEARSAKATRMHATGRLPLLRLFSTPLIDPVKRVSARPAAGAQAGRPRRLTPQPAAGHYVMRSCFEVNKQELGRMRDSHLGGQSRDRFWSIYGAADGAPFQNRGADRVFQQPLGDGLVRDGQGATGRVPALAGNLDVLGSGILAGLTAVFLTLRYDAAAGQVGAGFWFVRHDGLQNF